MDYGTVSAAFTSLKTLFQFAKTINNMELIEKIGDLQIKLGEVGQILNEQNDEIRKLKDENMALKKTSEINKNRTIIDNKQWIEGDPMPSCAYCYESKGKIIHLIWQIDRSFCKECGLQYNPFPKPKSFS